MAWETTSCMIESEIPKIVRFFCCFSSLPLSLLPARSNGDSNSSSIGISPVLISVAALGRYRRVGDGKHCRGFVLILAAKAVLYNRDKVRKSLSCASRSSYQKIPIL